MILLDTDVMVDILRRYEPAAELATFNVKHYRVFKGLQSLQPYEK
jgi:predicted nucleic acid-binding protein